MKKITHHTHNHCGVHTAFILMTMMWPPTPTHSAEEMPLQRTVTVTAIVVADDKAVDFMADCAHTNTPMPECVFDSPASTNTGIDRHAARTHRITKDIAQSRSTR